MKTEHGKKDTCINQKDVLFKVGGGGWVGMLSTVEFNTKQPMT